MKDYPSFVRNQSPTQPRRPVLQRQQQNETVSSIKLAIVGAILLGIALFFVQQRIEYIQTEKRVQKLLVEKQRLLTAILPLQLEERYLTQYEMVEEYATKNLGLKIPERKQIMVIQQLPESADKPAEEGK